MAVPLASVAQPCPPLARAAHWARAMHLCWSVLLQLSVLSIITREYIG